jgi:predicted PurR-regulated permease PerM
LLTGLALLGVLYLLYQLQQIVRWLIIAMFLAVALNPLVSLLARRLPRSVAILLVYLALILVVAGIGLLVVPPLVDQVQQLADQIGHVIKEPGGANAELEKVARQYHLEGYLKTLRSQAASLPGRLSAAAGPLVTVTKGIINSVTALVSILLLTFFLLLDGGRFIESGLTLFPASQRPRIRRVLHEAASAIYGYISGNLAISAIAGVTSFIALELLGIPYAVALALLVAFLDLIPLVGATLGAAILVIVGVFVEPVKGLILLGYFVVYQQIENNVLQPLVYGRSVRLHPLAIFLAVLAGGQLLGILGALIAIPCAEIIRIIAAEWVKTRRAAQSDDTTDENATPLSGSQPIQRPSGS